MNPIPPVVLMRLLRPMRIGAQLHPPGAAVALGVDVGAQLLHLRRAVPADRAGGCALIAHNTRRC